MPQLSSNRDQHTVVDKNLISSIWLTPLSAAIGGAVGGYLCFSAEGLKKRAQSSQPITLHSFLPRELFRGSTSFAASVGITSVAQFTINRTLHNLPSYNDQSVAWNATSAVASGMVGAKFSTVVENIILTQQLKKTGPFNAIKTLLSEGYGRPWLGLPELMVREAGFALTMLYGANAVSERVRQKTNNEYLAFIGQIGVGIAGAVVTHPADTTATYKQRHQVSTSVAIQSIYQDSRLPGFFKGIGYRAILFTGCMMVIPPVEKAAHTALKNLSTHSFFSRKNEAISQISTAPTLTANNQPENEQKQSPRMS